MFVLCEVETFFVEELDRSRCRVTKPLQIFQTQHAAELALDIFNPFYNFDLRVVPVEQIHETFR